jgi:Rne/Rng family ribonuclease
MTKEMIVSSNDRETRVAILEDDEVVEIFIERERQQQVAGNVYKGRVTKVLPGMQSAFVELGLERDGFLYVSDVVNNLESLDQIDEDDEETDAAGPAADGVDADADAASGDPGAVQDGADAAHHADGATPAARPGRPRRREKQSQSAPEHKIEDLLKEGQDVLVQIVKEPLGTKGARLTCHVTIPGRFLVFMPTVDHIGVSRKIEAREERARLRGIVRTFREQNGFNGGVIIRTAAAGRPEADILGDLSFFLDVWREIHRRRETQRAPAVLYREQSLVSKLIRDLLNDDYQAIRIDSQPEYRRAHELVERIMPMLAPRVKHYGKDFPIFQEYGVQQELDRALRSKVWLKSGGYIVINQTEALVAVDVNTGRYVGKKSAGRLEDTIIKTNLEAAKEIVRQIRLRDLGGIIVLDFIDMEEKKNRQKVYQAVEQELRRDRAPSKAVAVSEFGLVIVTRKRVKQSLERILTDQCPYCSGAGTVKSAATICDEILTELKKVSRDINGGGVVIRVNPDIARALQDDERDTLREIERAAGRRVTLKPDPLMHHERFDVMVT